MCYIIHEDFCAVTLLWTTYAQNCRLFPFEEFFVHLGKCYEVLLTRFFVLLGIFRCS